jgi:hypothetical protein
MRRKTIAVAALAALPVCASVAFADVQQKFDVAVSGTKAGTIAKPKAHTLRLVTGVDDTDTTKQPPTAGTVTISLAKGLRFNGAKFPSCTAAAIQAAKSTSACPAGSVVGTGKASGLVARGNPLRPAGISQTDLKITAVNGPRGRTLNLFVEGQSPLRIQSNIVGTLKKASGKYGSKLVVAIPTNLQSSPAGPIALTHFETTIKAKAKKGGKTVSYIDSTSCPKGGWSFRGTFAYSDGASKTVADKVACR